MIALFVQYDEKSGNQIIENIEIKIKKKKTFFETMCCCCWIKFTMMSELFHLIYDLSNLESKMCLQRDKSN